jgi:membrane-bound metal-dependent hydrolase YbcI (DUF457 family)
MPQNGFHGLVGLLTARALARRLPQPDWFVPGAVLGAMLPDADMYPTAIAVLLHRSDLTYVIHRSASHSLSFAVLLALAGLVVPRMRWLFAGLALGVLTHITLDIFFWFAPIDILWPLSHRESIDLWAHANVAPIFLNLREALEFAAFACMFRALYVIAPHAKMQLKKWEIAAWLLFAVALVTAVVFRETNRIQNFVVFTPYLVAFLPFCWMQVWKLRREIAAWAVRDAEEAQAV